jgi:hypothetical protein
MNRKFQLALFFLSFSLVSFSQSNNKLSLPKGCVQLTPGEMQWIDTSSVPAKGTKYCILYGDIKKAAPFAIRLQLPPNLVIKTHHHPNDEVVTVIDGSISVGFGDRTPSSETKTFTANSFYVNAANVEHFVVVGSEGVTIQINAVGPWVTTVK